MKNPKTRPNHSLDRSHHEIRIRTSLLGVDSEVEKISVLRQMETLDASIETRREADSGVIWKKEECMIP